MAQPYVGGIRMFGGTFAPVGWMDCDGTPLPISENETLFQLIGTTYGGDGESTFNLPDLRARLPVGTGVSPASGNTFVLAQNAGTVEETLTVQQMTQHTHALVATGDIGTQSNPGNLLLAQGKTVKVYGNDSPTGSLNVAKTVGPQGGSQPHTNMMPYLSLRFIISLFGIFPSPT